MTTVSVSGTMWSSSFETSSTRTHGRISMVAIGRLLLLFASMSFCLHVECQFSMGFEPVPGNNGSSGFAILPHRKLLISATLKEKEEEADRSWGEKRCSKSDLVIRQGQTKPLPSGIPTYTVEITNTCITKDCHISQIHLKCGWFSSARLVNPHIFKRISFDDCLVNDGKPLFNGDTISFKYANTFSYHLSVFSIHC